MKEPETDTPSHRIGTRSTSDDPEALAQHAIKLLEHKLIESHGVTPHIGAELEFCILSKPGQDVAETLLDKDGDEFDWVPSACRDGARKDAFFPDSPRINRTHREAYHPGTPWQQLEVVFSHMRQHREGMAPTSDALHLVHHIMAARRQITNFAHGKPLSVGKKNANESEYAAHMKHLKNYRQQLDSIRFTGSIENCPIKNGLQLNISFSDSNGCSSLVYPVNLVKLRRSLGAITDENLFLLGSSNTTINRWRSLYNDKVAPFNKQFTIKQECYLENRVPSSDSNPYYAMLLVLAGAIHALEHPQEEKAFTQPMDKLSPSSLYHNFRRATLLRDTLNELEPELGERFYAAISKTPPGHEASSLQMVR